MTPSISLLVSPDVALPADAAVQKFAWLGISGSGKTYGCGKFVEELIRTGAQVAVIDTIGNWWGLRLQADGKKPGFQIPILGGSHGDIPLEPEHGKLAAQTFVESGTSLIMDVSEFTGGELRRFVIDWATELLATSMRAPAPRHVVWEECQDIVPQKVFGDEARVLGAVQRLIKKGRNYGLGHSLISQRVAAVNKEVLYQCTTLFSFRTIGKLDRKAIEEYINDHDTDLTGPRPPLSKLATGRCLVYSPEWLKVSKEIAIGKKWTFDASATPDFAADAAPRAMTLSKVDLQRFTTTMSAAIQKAKDNDPELLKKRIRELEQMVDTGAMRPLDPTIIEEHENAKREVVGLREKLAEIATDMSSDTIPILDSMTALRNRIVRHALGPIDGLQTSELAAPPAPRQIHPSGPYPMPVVQPARREPRIASSPDDLSAMARTFLTVLAQRGVSLPKGKILVYANYAASGKASETFAQMLAEGWVESPATGHLQITAAGRKKLGAYTPLPVGDALYKAVVEGSRLNAMEKLFLAEIRRVYPGAIGKGVILECAGYAASGKASEAFARLVALDYATKNGPGFLRLSDDLTNTKRA